MSKLLSTNVVSSFGYQVVISNDNRLRDYYFSDRDYTCYVTTNGWMDYSNDFWPRSSLALGDQGVDFGPEPITPWQQVEYKRGMLSRKSFTGFTRSVNNSPLAGATVRLFRASDGLLVDTATSAADGSFVLHTAYYTEPHYVVSYKIGGVDVNGVTPQTLVGA